MNIIGWRNIKNWFKFIPYLQLNKILKQINQYKLKINFPSYLDKFDNCFNVFVGVKFLTKSILINAK